MCHHSWADFGVFSTSSHAQRTRLCRNSGTCSLHTQVPLPHLELQGLPYLNTVSSRGGCWLSALLTNKAFFGCELFNSSVWSQQRGREEEKSSHMSELNREVKRKREETKPQALMSQAHIQRHRMCQIWVQCEMTELFFLLFFLKLPMQRVVNQHKKWPYFKILAFPWSW